MSAAVCLPCATGDPKCAASGMQCRGEPAVTCEDEDPCTEDLTFCVKDEGKCECRSAPATDGTPCKADANTCTTGDTCQLGKCVAGQPAELTSENPCVELVCVKGKIEEKLLGGPCTDGDPCTFGDRCTLGQCVPEGLIECPADPCASQTYCDKNQGKCVSEPRPDGTECDLDDPCITRALCQRGVCVIEEGVRCDDEQPCTLDKCDPETKHCSHEPLADGTPCGDAGTCENGLCTENLPPSAPEVRIVPDKPQPGDGLTCAITVPSQDPEGEEVAYSFAWLRDGVPAQAHTSQDIPAGTTLECEVWTCTVTPRPAATRATRAPTTCASPRRTSRSPARQSATTATRPREAPSRASCKARPSPAR